MANTDLQSGISDAFDVAQGAQLSTKFPVELITDAVNILLSLVGVVALAVLVYGGFLFITSTGDEEKAAHAKRLILYAIVGLLLIGASVIIVNLVISLFST